MFNLWYGSTLKYCHWLSSTLWFLGSPAGLFFILPCIDDLRVVDLRTQVIDVPPQEVHGPVSCLCAWLWQCVFILWCRLVWTLNYRFWVILKLQLLRLLHTHLVERLLPSLLPCLRLLHLLLGYAQRSGGLTHAKFTSWLCFSTRLYSRIRRGQPNLYC